MGIGGIGVSAIARMLLAEGKIVSGSDTASSAIIDELRKIGAKVFIGHNAENVSAILICWFILRPLILKIRN